MFFVWVTCSSLHKIKEIRTLRAYVLCIKQSPLWLFITFHRIRTCPRKLSLSQCDVFWFLSVWRTPWNVLLWNQGLLSYLFLVSQIGVSETRKVTSPLLFWPENTIWRVENGNLRTHALWIKPGKWIFLSRNCIRESFFFTPLMYKSFVSYSWDG